MASIRKELRRRRAEGEKWRIIGAAYPGVPLGTLCRIAHDATYEPKSARLRAHLGLAPLPVEVSPCAKCGQLHEFRSRCPGAPTKYAAHPVMRLAKIERALFGPYHNS